MSSALEYLKREEADGRKAVIRRTDEAVNAVQNANFWAEVNRIRENGGWRAEEERISLGNGILTPEQQAELDREAKELIQVRKELLEKKKQEEQQKKEDEKSVRELLLSEPALSWKMRVSPNDETKRYWPDHPCAGGYSELNKWNPNEAGKSAKEMLEAYMEIHVFRATSLPLINVAVKKLIDELWEGTTDYGILQRDQQQKSGNGSWESYGGNIKYALGISDIKNIDIDWWKAIVITEIGMPLFNEEWKKWHFYFKKFIERSQGKPTVDETLRKVHQLEENIVSLTKRNEFLEEKVSSIRSIIQF